jgi:hypothetical protein
METQVCHPEIVTIFGSHKVIASTHLLLFNLSLCEIGRSKENEPSHAIGVEFESRVGSPNLSFLGLKVDKMEIQQQGSSSAAHPFLNNTHHDHHAHHRDATSNGLASLAASFVTPAAAVSKGVKMKFRSSRYEVRW